MTSSEGLERLALANILHHGRADVDGHGLEVDLGIAVFVPSLGPFHLDYVHGLEVKQNLP